MRALASSSRMPASPVMRNVRKRLLSRWETVKSVFRCAPPNSNLVMIWQTEGIVTLHYASRRDLQAPQTFRLGVALADGVFH